MGEKVNDTIMKLVTNFKSGIETNDKGGFEFSTPSKRPSPWKDTPSPAKRSRQEFDLTYLGSPREIRRLRADLIEARNNILNLEKRVEHMHNVRKEMQLMFDNESKALERQHEHDRRSIEELESQLQTIRQREVKLKEELATARNDYNVLKVKTDEKIEELEKTLYQIKEETQIADRSENSEIADLKRKIEELQIVLEAAEEDAEAQKKLVQELEKRLSEKNVLERDLELKDQALHNARLRIKELEYAKETYLEYQEQANAQIHKLANYTELEKENDRLKEEIRRLKDEVKNKLILEEEVFDLRTRLNNYKDSEKKLANLQAHQLQKDHYLDEWRAVARQICETTGSDSSLPHLLRTAVERLQQQEIALTSAKVELESQLNAALYDAKVARNDSEKQQKLLAEIKRTSDQKQALIHRMQKKLSLVSRERDSYRLQLDSYEKDLTLCMNATAPNTNQQIQNQRERIEHLENVVENYREMVNKLETDLQNVQPAAYSEIPNKQTELNRLHDEIDKLRLENERLRDRKDQLEMQLEDQLTGNDTLNGGKVYHLAENPLSKCLAERERHVEKLQDEVDRLKRKIKNLEDGIEASRLNESELSPKEVQTLKEQIQGHDAQIQRLKDYFRSSMQEFRNVIYMLLGYKVDRTSNSMYKLTSIYAERPEQHLCFQVNSEGVLNLLENEFSATLEQMITLHLRQQNSIPVFLSTITLDLFATRSVTMKSLDVE